MLQLFDKNKTNPVPVVIGDETTIFNFRSMTIADKIDLLHNLQNTTPEDQTEFSADEAKAAIEETVTKLCACIDSIQGYDEKPTALLMKLERVQDLQAIVSAVLSYCLIEPEQAKNSDSLPAQPTPATVGNAEDVA